VAVVLHFGAIPAGDLVEFPRAGFRLINVAAACTVRIDASGSGVVCLPGMCG
jgi:hypothetical protein